MNVSCDSRMNDLIDNNNFFIFDDVNIRISPVSKMPFRKKPLDSMNIVQIYIWIINSGCSKHMTGNRALLTNFVEKFLGTVRFGNNDFAVIAGYRDYDDKEHGVDLLTGDRSSNLYTISLNEVASNSSTCILPKAFSSQSWLWHQRISRLNFTTINNLVKNNLVQGLPKMKFEKDHLCSACEQGKIHQKHHKSKMDFASNKPLYLLHMDLCGPMCIQSINRKRYVLVFVNDYSWGFYDSRWDMNEPDPEFTQYKRRNGVVLLRTSSVMHFGSLMLKSWNCKSIRMREKSARFMNYLEEQTDGQAMINSIKNGDQPLPHVTQVSIAETTSTEQPPLKDKSMWKAAVLNEYETFKTTKGELLLDTYIQYLQVINDLKKCGYSKDNCELNFKFLNNLQPEWKQDVNDAMGSKKKTVVVTSDPLALIAKKTKVSKSKEKVVISSDIEGSDADDFSELKKITALLAKAFNRRNFYSKPTNNNLRTSSTFQSANKKQEFVKNDNKKVEKKDDEKKRDMSRVKCYNCKKEGHFTKDCKKVKFKDYEYYKTKMLLAKKDKDEQVLLAEDQAWMESSKASSSSGDEKISKVSYYLSESESESEFETLEYYDNSTNYSLFMNNDDDQEIFHDAIESACENFIDNHIDSQKDYDKSDVDHNDSEQKYHLVDKLIRKFNKKIVKCQKYIEKANQQSKDFENQNKDLQDKYDVLKNQATIFKMNNKKLNEELKDLIEKNNDFLAQTIVLKDQLQVKHVVIDTHVECQEKYAKLEAERYEYMIRCSAYFDNDIQHRKQIADQEVLYGKMSVQLVELDKHVRALEIKKFKRSRENKIEFAYDYENLNASYVNEKINFKDDYFQEIINPDFKKIDSPFQHTSSLKPYVLNVILKKIIIDLKDEVVNLLKKEKVNLETIESLKSKSFESSEKVSSELENQSENDCLVVEKECDKEENPKVIAPVMFKLSVSPCVSQISMSKSSCDSKNVEIKLKRKRRKRKSSKQNKKKGSSNTFNVGLSVVSVSNLDKNVKRYSRKDLLACNNSHLGETRSDFVCNDAINVSCDSRMNDLLDDNNFFIFDDESVRISLVSKMPFRKKPRDSINRVHICLWIIDSRCSKHMTGNRALLTNFVEKFFGTVRFGNNDFVVIAGYEDVVIGSMTIKKVYYVKGLRHNLFSVGQFCDKGFEVAFRKSTCFIRNEDGVDLLTGYHSSNLYTIALNEVASNSLTCLLAKASSSQSWLWHQRLS
nr:integrase, catalytic region, zinc finger, CCHC-type, peptidase aspartic, catalytic [Tanacetum cinerariifolium]